MNLPYDSTINLTASTASKRADIYLASVYDASRSYFTRLLEEGLILVNGQKPKKSQDIKEGDSITVTFPKEELPDLSPKEMSINVLFETDRYAVIDKPAGVAVHPAPGHYDDSLVNGLLHKFSIDDEDAGYRPGIVHRLDKDTSGLLIIAKDRKCREVISTMFQNRQIDKYYKAVCFGVPRFRSIIIETEIARDSIHRKRMQVVKEGGKHAKTQVKVAEIFSKKKAFLADIKLFTGRTHQIRVHMAYLKHPLLGDELYGSKTCSNIFHRQALHAARLQFTDPFTSANIDISSPLPEDITLLIKSLV